MRTSATMRLALAAVAGAACLAVQPVAAQATKACRSDSFSHLIGSTSVIPGGQITDVQARHLQNELIPARPPLFPEGRATACEVVATYIQPGTNSSDIHVTVWLPPTEEEWNGRLVGNGGGGWQCSMGLNALLPTINAGFATSTTDGGLTGIPFEVDWTLRSPGNPNRLYIERLGHTAIHHMTHFAKHAVREYYGRPAQTNYYIGCSTGGRQGTMEASRYPEDYDGYLIGAPAVRWNNLLMRGITEPVTMHQERYFPSECEFNAIIEAATEACDDLDGRVDGIVMRPDLCTFAASNAVGRPYDDYCDGKGEIRRVTETAAKIMQIAVDGPSSSTGFKIGSGWPWGTNITDGPTSTARTRIDPSTGVRTSDPFALTKQWIEDYLWYGLKEADYDALTLDDAETLAKQSSDMYTWIMEPENDLSRIRDRGGKIIMYHGTQDAIITVGNTIQKHDEIMRATFPRIRRDADRLKALQGFLRLFLVNGMAHCRPQPQHMGKVPFVASAAFQQLIQWVEGGVAPEELVTDGVSDADRPALGRLCLWPKQPMWTHGGTRMECRGENIWRHLLSRLPRLRDLPILYMEHLPLWLGNLTRTEKEYEAGKAARRQSKAKAKGEL